MRDKGSKSLYLHFYEKILSFNTLIYSLCDFKKKKKKRKKVKFLYFNFLKMLIII